MALTKKQRAELRGMFGGKCAYCGYDLPEKGWHADHKEPVIRQLDIYTGKTTCGMRKPENDVFENFFPSCAPCNLLKSSRNIEQFRKLVKKQIDYVNKYSNHFRHAKRFGLVTENDYPVVFWFERFNHATNR